MLALANNRDETVIQAELDLEAAGRKYAREALQYPAFLRPHWKQMLAACRRQIRRPDHQLPRMNLRPENGTAKYAKYAKKEKGVTRRQ
jgi:hypothetical protein